MTSPLRRLYGQVSERHLLYLALAGPQLWVDRSGRAMALAGQHSGWGYCWCQPTVTWCPGVDGRWRPQVTHRRVADMSDAAYDDLGRASWTVEDGHVYPDRSFM